MSTERPGADVLRVALREIAHGALAAAVIGLFVNLLYLAVPFYTMQVYNRVISSRSYETVRSLVARGPQHLDAALGGQSAAHDEQFHGPSIGASLPTGRQRRAKLRERRLAAVARAGGITKSRSA